VTVGRKAATTHKVLPYRFDSAEDLASSLRRSPRERFRQPGPCARPWSAEVARSDLPLLAAALCPSDEQEAGPLKFSLNDGSPLKPTRGRTSVELPNVPSAASRPDPDQHKTA
jgi:hypothetical protein